MRARALIRVPAVAACAALLAAFAAPVARADVAVLDGTPLNVYADGLGALQVRYDGQAAGLFYPPDTNPGHAGLEILEGTSYYPLVQDFAAAPGRVGATPVLTDLGNGTRALHSVYTVGPDLQVTEDVTYTDGQAQLAVRYAIANRSAAPVSLRAGELADLYVGADDNGKGVFSSVAPRFVGGQSPLDGLVSGVQELTPWGAFQEGDYESVFSNFATGGLNGTVDPDAPDNGVGVQFGLDALAPGETRTLDVRWLLAAPAPPGTATPGASGAGGPPPPPVAGKTVNLKPIKNPVFYKLPGARTFKRLTGEIQVEVGTTLDTTHGRVTLTSAADLNGTTQHAWFYSGVFTVTQTAGVKPVTELSIPRGALRCARASSARASAKKPRTRRLWGDGTGSFRTRGHYSAATVRGTKWVVIDRCDGTLTRVSTGTVAVRDTARRKTVLVRAGTSYLARKPK